MSQISGTAIRLDIDGFSRDIVYKVASERNCSLGQAVSLIFKEWHDISAIPSTENETEPSYLDGLSLKLDSIDRQLDEVLLKLKRASL